MRIFDLTGKVAVVTGGNGGIGLGMAKGLAEAGADIVVAARNAEKAATACVELRALGRRAEFVQLDVANEASCRGMIEQAVACMGRLDILVNNAGMNIRKPPEIMTSDEFRMVIDTNVTGAFVCAQAAYPHLLRAGGGKIINVASLATKLALPRMTAYAPSKAALVQLTRTQASAWAKDNIQVNAVLPGWIDTEWTQRSAQTAAGFAQKVIERTPAGRWGRPDDFAGVAVYLASSASAYMTGSEVVIDGGYSFSV